MEEREGCRSRNCVELRGPKIFGEGSKDEWPDAQEGDEASYCGDYGGCRMP